MSKNENNDLIKKYLEAETSIQEEEQLLNQDNLNSNLSSWFQFVRKTKRKAPASLNDRIMSAIESQKKRKQRFMISAYGIAASIALFIAVFIYNSKSTNDEYLQNEALLNEALSMFTEDEVTAENQKIIYEDEMIIIYLASNESLKNSK